MRISSAQNNLSQQDLRKYYVLRDVMGGKIPPDEACHALNVSVRQVRRMIERVRKEGANGVVHKLRGRRSNRCLPPSVKKTVLKIYAKNCASLGPAAARERIWRHSRIKVNRETLRKWLIAAGLWQIKKPSASIDFQQHPEVTLFHWPTR